MCNEEIFLNHQKSILRVELTTQIFLHPKVHNNVISIQILLEFPDRFIFTISNNVIKLPHVILHPIKDNNVIMMHLLLKNCVCANLV